MNIKPNMTHSTIFLAGTIDMGDSINWQDKLVEEVEKRKKENQEFSFYNPRRDDWDSTWDHESKEFLNQVNWELDHLEKCDLILMKLLKGSTSVISMLELGLFAKSGKLSIYCEKGYWRKGNVDFICRKYNVDVLNSDEEMIQKILNS